MRCVGWLSFSLSVCGPGALAEDVRSAVVGLRSARPVELEVASFKA